jgi:CPA1 family monovalent cation:H+ antiporter
MTTFDAAAILIVLAATLGYLNSRLFHLPHAIGLVIMRALASLALVAVDIVVPTNSLVGALRTYLRDFDFQEKFLNGMLSFLIFAGALQVDLNALMQRRWMVLA